MSSIEKAIEWAVNCCNAENIGYSQIYRNAQTVGGITYYDCSSFINYALIGGGFSTPSYAPSNNAFTTVTMGAELERLGFKKVTDGTLKPGDIGVSNNDSSQHTEMVYQVDSTGTKGYWMGAHTDSVPLADQVSITYTYLGLWFDELYRYDTEEEKEITITVKKLKENGSYFKGASLELQLESRKSGTWQKIQAWDSPLHDYTTTFKAYFKDGENRKVRLIERATNNKKYSVAGTIEQTCSKEKTALTFTMTNKMKKQYKAIWGKNRVKIYHIHKKM